MKCPTCKTENQNIAKFCIECGHNLLATSSPAVTPSTSDQVLTRFQQHLSPSITGRSPAKTGQIEGERRQVTVMFCDMEGFTPFVEKVGPEESFGLMGQIYEILIRKVHEFGGTVNELTGDGIMAFFGAPIALENAPLRSLRTALSIHDEINQFNQLKNIDPPVQMRIGINTGIVVTGTLGNDLRFEYKAVGDTVNLASRMEDMAEPGTTYVTENTFKIVDGLLNFEALGQKDVKGKKDAVRIYKLLSADDYFHTPRLGFERQIFSTMIGRDLELARLERLMLEAIDGSGSVVNIIGEAGIGKSRLIAEFRRNTLIKEVTFLEGRAISIGRNLSYHLVIDICRQWAQIRENDNEALAFRKLQLGVKSLFPEEFDDVLPFVATLMGMKLPGAYAERLKGIRGEALENLILKNVRNLIIKATELTPLVVVMEDLHWADTSSIMLLESLFRLVETQRILFINVFRPGYKETGDRISKSIREKVPKYVVNIELSPLSRRMSEELITDILDIRGLHHAVIKDMIHKTGGNPFFIEEAVRSLIDERAIIVKDGIFQVTERISSVTMPNSINDVLMARFDRLEENTRNLLKVASVIGRSFFYRILSEVASDIEDIDSSLSHLQEIEIIRKRERMGELEYLFKHALAQEAAYESILPKKREALHRQVAGSIEKVFEKRLHEFYGMLAYHYSCANDLEKTEEFLIKAGEEALRSSASNEALNFYQEALKLYLDKHDSTIDPGRVAMLEKNIALAYYNRGHYAESIDYFDKALRYYWGPMPKSPVTQTFAFIAQFFYFLYCVYFPFFKFKKTPTLQDIESVDLFTKKLKALAIINPKKFFLESFHFYKWVWQFDPTEFDIGIGLFVGASTLFSFTGMSFRLSRKILNVIRDRASRTNPNAFIIYDFSDTMHNYFEGDWKSIALYDEDLVNDNLSVGELYWTSQHYFWHANPLHYQGRFDLTQKLVDHLLELSRVYENDLALLLKYLLNTNVLIDSGKLDEALVEIEEAIEFGQVISQGSILIEMYSRKAHIQILKGNIEDAEVSLELAASVSKEIDTVPWQLSDLVKGKCEFDLYKLKNAKQAGIIKDIFVHRKKAKKSTKKMLKVAGKVAQNRTESYLYQGVYFWLVGKPEEAFKWWRRSIADGERMDARLALSRTYFEIGKQLLSNEYDISTMDGIGAEDYLEKASAMFKEMDLRRDLDEVNRLINN